MHRLVGRTAGDAWKHLAGGNNFAEQAAYELASTIKLPTDQAFDQVSMHLRTLGVLCCIMADRDLAKCDCLFSLEKDVGGGLVKQQRFDMARAGIWPTAA